MDRYLKMRLRSLISLVDQYLTHRRARQSSVVWCRSMTSMSNYAMNLQKSFLRHLLNGPSALPSLDMYAAIGVHRLCLLCRGCQVVVTTMSVVYPFWPSSSVLWWSWGSGFENFSIGMLLLLYSCEKSCQNFFYLFHVFLYIKRSNIHCFHDQL